MTVWWFTKEHDTRVRLVLEWKVNLNLNEDKCKVCENTNLRGRRTLRIKPDPRKTSAINVAHLKNKDDVRHFIPQLSGHPPHPHDQLGNQIV